LINVPPIGRAPDIGEAIRQVRGEIPSKSILRRHDDVGVMSSITEGRHE